MVKKGGDLNEYGNKRGINRKLQKLEVNDHEKGEGEGDGESQANYSARPNKNNQGNEII